MVKLPEKLNEEIEEMVKTEEKPEEIYDLLNNQGYNISLDKVTDYCSEYIYEKYLKNDEDTADYNTFKKLFRDPNFREIYYSENLNGNNPFILREAMEKRNEKAKSDLWEQLKTKEPKERLIYFGYLTEGRNLLKKLGKL